MFIGQYKQSALGSVLAPDFFDESQIPALPGLTFNIGGGRIMLDTLDGWIHEYRELSEAETLDGFFSKIFKPVKKVFKKVASIPKKIFKEAKRVASRVNAERKRATRKALQNKYGRALVRGIGAVAAPFTGGLSLAAAEASARYGKARYGQGLSRSQAFKSGAVGAALGYVGGRAISAGYQAVKQGGVSALNPFATKPTAAINVETAAQAGAKGAGVGVGTTTPATTGGGLWGKIGKGALKVGTTAAKSVAASYITAYAQGRQPGAEEVIYGVGSEYMPAEYAALLAAGVNQPSPTAYAADTWGSYAVAPADFYEEAEQAPAAFDSEALKKWAPFAIIGAGLFVSVLVLKK